MFLARRPSPATIETFLEEARTQPLSYDRVGLAAEIAPAGFRVDEARIALGHGDAVFTAAAAAIAGWRHFELGWVHLYPRAAPIEPGTVVAIVVSHLGFWSMNACRIVYLLGGADAPGAARSSPVREYGFAYGTLAEHAETGEETFGVSIDAATGLVTYAIRAVSHERAWLARLGAPVARAFQDRFRRDSLQAVKRAVEGGAVP